MQVLTIFLILAFVIFIWYLFHYNSIVLFHWSHGFDQLQFSTQDFYKSVQTSLEKREVPGISFSRATYLTKFRTVVFDGRREYLCATREEYEFRICAAPFGTGFFVSWWFVEKEQGYVTLLKRISFLKWILGIKTFYQIDTPTRACLKRGIAGSNEDDLVLHL